VIEDGGLHIARMSDVGIDAASGIRRAPGAAAEAFRTLPFGRRRLRVLCHEHRRSKRRCVTVLEMKEGPSGSAIRSPIPSHRERLWSKATVVSVAEKPGR
jgi:hypothetical protein